MAYKISLTDSSGTYELPPLNVPLTREKYEKATVVETLSGNVYTDYIATKRIYTHTWAYMSKDEFDMIDAIYERQKTLFQYPTVDVEGEGISNMTAQFLLDKKNIIDNCGTVQNVSITLRETRQRAVPSA